MKKAIVICVVSICAAFSLSSCDRQTMGAVGGAAVGGTVGGLAGGTTGAVIGGVAGAAAGSIIAKPSN